MAKPETIQESEKVTPELAYKLLVDSFRLSSGSPGFQGDWLRLMFDMHKNYRVLPDSDEGRKIRDYLVSPHIKAEVHKFVSGERHPATGPTSEGESTITWYEEGVVPFLRFLSSKSTRLSQTTTKKMLSSLIYRDQRAFERGFRKNSFIADFIIPGTRRDDLWTDAFRRVCKQLAEEIRRGGVTMEQMPKLKEIQDLHNKSIPQGEQVNIVDQLRMDESE